MSGYDCRNKLCFQFLTGHCRTCPPSLKFYLFLCLRQQQRRALCFRVVRPAVRCPLSPACTSIENFVSLSLSVNLRVRFFNPPHNGRFADKPVIADKTFRWQLACRWMHLSTMLRSCYLVSKMSSQRTGCHCVSEVERTGLSAKRPWSRRPCASCICESVYESVFLYLLNAYFNVQLGYYVQ